MPTTVKAIDCYVEEIRKCKDGRAILPKRQAVMFGYDKPRLKIVDPPTEGEIGIGIVSRPSDKLFLGIFMADEKSHFDHGEVRLTEDISSENLHKLVEAGIVSVDDKTKSIIRNRI